MYKKNRARICKRLRGPGIDSKESIPPAYVARRADTSNRVVVPARQAVNRFLGFLKGLQIRAQGLHYIFSPKKKACKPVFSPQELSLGLDNTIRN